MHNEPFIRIPYDSREEWLELRKKGLGGSDVAAAIGQNPYKDNVRLYQEKIGLVEPEDIGDKKQVKYGHAAEDHIRALFALEHEEDLEVIHTNDLLVSKEKDYLRGSLDGELIEKSIGRKGILEIKTTDIMASYHLESWKDNNVPINYYCQLLHYFYITGYAFAILVVEMRRHTSDGIVFVRKEYHFEREDILSDMEWLKSEAIKFWEEHIIPKKAPNLKIDI